MKEYTLMKDSAATSRSSRTTLTTRAAYSSLLNKMNVPPTCENRILNSGFTKDNIQDVYLLPFKVTKQTKVIHNVLVNQVSLFNAGITENDNCPLCNCEKQTTRPTSCLIASNPRHFGIRLSNGGTKNSTKLLI